MRSCAVHRGALTFALLAALALVDSALAYSNVAFKHLSLEHGLAQSAVQDMASDELGYMWFGTQYGLSRYDGYGFRNFRHVPDDPASLSNSRIQDLLLARDGRLWVGTRSGLNRLDPETLRIERIVLEGGGGMPATQAPPHIRKIAEGQGGDLLIETTSGPVHYEYRTGRLRRLESARGDALAPGGTVASDPGGRLWWYNADGLWTLDAEAPALRLVLETAIDGIAVRHGSMVVMASGLLALAEQGGIVLFDPEREAVVRRIGPEEQKRISGQVAALSADPRGGLWVLTRRYLARYRTDLDQWRVELERWQYGAAETDRVYGVSAVADAQGYVWVGLPEGVGLSAPDESGFRLLQHDPNEPESLKASPWSSAYSVYVDAFGVTWVGGGLGGLSRFAPQRDRFEHIIDERVDGVFGTDNVIRSVLEVESAGQVSLWTGLSFSGIRIWRRGPAGFDRVVAELNTLADEPFRIPDNQVWALARHPDTGEVWAGTNDGLAAISPRDFSVKRIVPVRVDGRPVRVKAIEFSRDGQTLYAAGSKRLMRFDLGPDRRRVIDQSIRSTAPPETGGNEYDVFDMIWLDRERLLVGTRRGLVVWRPATDEIEHEYPSGQSGEQPKNFVFGMVRTGEDTVWIGTELSGLARSRFVDGRFGPWAWFDRDDGLPDNTVYAMLASPDGRLWLSSNRGLIRFNPATEVTRHFTLADGLQALEFNNTVATIGESGRLYFGGINGVNAFRPESIRLHPQPPRVLLQRARIGERVIAMDASDVARARGAHDRSALVAEFVGLHFVQPERNRYAYRLDGVDNDWVYDPPGRRVRYPDLAPGDYELMVKAANSDGVWSQPRVLLSVGVSPPPWMTPWAYSFYIAVAASLIGMFLMAERRRRRRLEDEVAQRTRELMEQKELVDSQAHALEESLETRTTLFANISHEFRTPLTLIEASLERLVRNPEDQAAFASARRYLRRLLRLVDQLLNLSRLQSTRQQTLPDPWSLDQVVTMTVEAFRPLAEDKELRLIFEADGRWSTQCQQADVERILLNLLGNALKYCPPGSTIRLALEAEAGGVVIRVADDGPGIAHEQQEEIFERFNRMPAHEQGRIEGAGIGLTLVREAARSNGGDATVQSEPGQGAEFRVWLPAWRGHMQGAPVDQLAPQRLQLELETLAVDDAAAADDLRGTLEGETSPGHLGTVLVVEDNSDLRRHLTDLLTGDWQVLVAEDGREGLQLARERLPDVVVSDIMMPQIDGLELLKRLRQDVRTSHLPVLLLTARQDDETRMRGYSLSADDFLAKPFRAEELRLRLRRMVDIRANVQARLWRQLETSGQASIAQEPEGKAGGAPDLSERDQQLLDRIRSWLEANHDDPDAGIATLATFLSMESRTLQRKLRALTGRTPAEHLRHFRMERARCMLRETTLSIQEVAYSCGFSSPQYFSRLFAQEEGMPPTRWRESSPD